MSRRARAILWSCVVVVVVAGTAGLTWRKVLRDRFFPKRFGVVLPDEVVRSGQLHPALVGSFLDDQEIEVVIDLTHAAPTWEPDRTLHAAEIEAVADRALDYRLFPLIGDGTGDPEVVANAIAALHEARMEGRKAWVHCAAGTHRTGMVVAIYEMLVLKRDPAAVWQDMTLYDWDPDDSPIPAYVESNLPFIAQRLVELGVLDAVPDPLPRLAPGRRDT